MEQPREVNNKSISRSTNKVKKSLFSLMEIKRPPNKLKQQNISTKSNTFDIHGNRKMPPNSGSEIKQSTLKKSGQNRKDVKDRKSGEIPYEEKNAGFLKGLNSTIKRRTSCPNLKRTNSKFYLIPSDMTFEENSSEFDNKYKSQSLQSKNINITNKNEESAIQREQISSSQQNLPSEEEDFGYNGFDKCADNYILEAYNKDDQYLIKMMIDVRRESLRLDDIDVKVNMKERDCHMLLFEDEQLRSIEIIQQYETDSSDESSDEDIHEITLNLSRDKFDKNESRFEWRTVLKVLKEDLVDCDGNIRISRDGRDVKTSNNYIISSTSTTDKVKFIIDELIMTEEQYVTGLRKVVQDYKPYIEGISQSLALYILSNIESIYQEAQAFLTKLQNSSTIEDICESFLSSREMFQLYPVYTENKPRSDFYLKQFNLSIKKKQNQLGDRLDLASYLLTPIQRLGKYILLLQTLQKELQKFNENNENLGKCLELVRTTMQKGNDSIAIASINNCPLNFDKLGSCLMRESFQLLKPLKKEVMLFLFEQEVIFTELDKSKHLESYNYLSSIPLNDLSIAPMENELYLFHLWNYSNLKEGHDNVYVLDAKTPKIKEKWTKTIEKLLWKQLEIARGKRAEKYRQHIQKKPIDKKKNEGLTECVPNKYYYYK